MIGSLEGELDVPLGVSQEPSPEPSPVSEQPAPSQQQRSIRKGGSTYRLQPDVVEHNVKTILLIDSDTSEVTFPPFGQLWNRLNFIQYIHNSARYPKFHSPHIQLYYKKALEFMFNSHSNLLCVKAIYLLYLIYYTRPVSRGHKVPIEISARQYHRLLQVYSVCTRQQIRDCCYCIQKLRDDGAFSIVPYDDSQILYTPDNWEPPRIKSKGVPKTQQWTSHRKRRLEEILDTAPDVDDILRKHDRLKNRIEKMIEQARAEGLDLGELNWPPEINYETKMEGAFSTMNRLAQGMLKRVLKAEKEMLSESNMEQEEEEEPRPASFIPAGDMPMLSASRPHSNASNSNGDEDLFGDDEEDE